ncbi:MAG: HAD family hydrolase [Rickettsia endosymbiont of Oxypoda opaca]|nr:HAD family hydrolase [Rickettsia endosymbiont of Oxypoda opaca]
MGKEGIESRATEQNKNDVVFCFDVDGTLINENSHNYITRVLFWQYGNTVQEGREDEIREYMQKFLADPIIGWKNKKETENLMSEILEAGYKIAIVTHNIFRVAIKYLVEQLELSVEDKSKIFVVLGDFVNTRQKQIEKVKEHFKIEKFQNIVLIDDNEDNIIAAKEADVQTVIVNKYGVEYLRYASKLLRNFLNPDDVSTEELSSDGSADEVIVIDFEKCNLSNGEYTFCQEKDILLGDAHYL